jgi:hypothetical protein
MHFTSILEWLKILQNWMKISKIESILFSRTAGYDWAQLVRTPLVGPLYQPRMT